MGVVTVAKALPCLYEERMMLHRQQTNPHTNPYRTYVMEAHFLLITINRANLLSAHSIVNNLWAGSLECISGIGR